MSRGGAVEVVARCGLEDRLDISPFAERCLSNYSSSFTHTLISQTYTLYLWHAKNQMQAEGRPQGEYLQAQPDVHQEY